MTDKPFLRNHFFDGRLLTAKEFELEQTYFREKLKLHNRSLHGFGIVSGLEVSQRQDKLIVTSGLAIDCEGNEIVVAEPIKQPLPEISGGVTTIFLNVRYSEKETKPDGTDRNPNGSCEQILIEESFVTAFESRNSNQHHRHVKGRWQACGEPHGLVIARLRRSSGQWRLDRRLHRPFVK